MQEMANVPDLGFVVDWQISDDSPAVIDLSTAESEVLLPDDATIESSFGFQR